MKDKRMTLFFADTLRERDLTDEDELALQLLLFPSFSEDKNKAVLESTADMMSAFTRWEAKQGKEQKPQPKVEPMTEAEIDEIAQMF